MNEASRKGFDPEVGLPKSGIDAERRPEQDPRTLEIMRRIYDAEEDEQIDNALIGISASMSLADPRLRRIERAVEDVLVMWRRIARDAAEISESEYAKYCHEREGGLK